MREGLVKVLCVRRHIQLVTHVQCATRSTHDLHGFSGAKHIVRFFRMRQRRAPSRILCVPLLVPGDVHVHVPIHSCAAILLEYPPHSMNIDSIDSHSRRIVPRSPLFLAGDATKMSAKNDFAAKTDADTSAD